MPRNLARLRFRAPLPRKLLSLKRIHPDDHAALQDKLRSHALDLSKPQTDLSLQIVVNPKWKQQPDKKYQHLFFRPHTVRDLVDPESTAKHGQIIYVFANIKTGQVIYSLGELLDAYHIDQLPFLGKHSKPPVIRPDEWTPHCVVTFPSPEQGRHAFRMLREFRHLHETSWDKTNPEWIRLAPFQRMKKIMNQVANTSADLAEVLNIQKQQSVGMWRKVRDQEKKAIVYMNKSWQEVEALTTERDANNLKWLEQQIRSLNFQLGAKRHRDEADIQRIKNAKKSHEVRLRKVLWARRKAGALQQIQENGELKQLHDKLARLEQLNNLKEEAESLVKDPEALRPNPHTENEQTAKTEDGSTPHQSRLEQQQQKIGDLEKSFEYTPEDIPTARAILSTLQSSRMPRPFTMDVDIKWTDLRNAEYAAGKWPEDISHDTLNLRSSREGIKFLDRHQYRMAVEDDAQAMKKELERTALEAQGLLQEEQEAEVEPEKTGVWKYLPELKNPLKRAEA